MDRHRDHLGALRRRGHTVRTRDRRWRGEGALAIGDVLGSSFADATLSISIGPLLFPTVIDGDLALTAALVTAGAAGVVALLLGRGGELGRRGAAILLLVYASSWALLL